MENTEKKYKAFSLAEVIAIFIVLGVISVTAIPSVMKTNFRRTSITRVKKMYLTLQSALDSMIIFNNYENINFRNYPATTAGANKVFEDFIKPYIKVSYVAGTDSQNKAKIMDCTKPMKLLTGSYHTSDYCNSSKYFSVKLNDGSTITMRGYNNEDLYFSFDMNGEKGPNTLGRDIFRFYLTPEKNRDYIYPPSDNNLKSCISQGNGGWECAEWVVVKGNMDYLDCPGNYNWTKNKCNK